MTLMLPLDAEASDHGILPALVVPQDQGALASIDDQLYRLFYVVSGTPQAVVNIQEKRLDKGQLVALAPGETIEFEPSAQVLSVGFHYHFFCIHIRKDEFFCDGIVFNRKEHSPICSVDPEARDLVRSSFDEINRALVDRSPLTRSRAVSALHTLLVQFAEFMIDGGGKNEDSDPMVHQSELTRRFASMLEAHFHIRHDVEFYCDALNVTQTTLNRRLKKELGSTTSKAIQDRIAIEARHRLADGRSSVKEVAFALGFDDQLYFSRFFKKHFGSSPSEYFQT